MKKIQLVIFACSALFLASCILLTGIRFSKPAKQDVVSSRRLILEHRLDAINQAQQAGETSYTFESMIAPPLI